MSRHIEEKNACKLSQEQQELTTTTDNRLLFTKYRDKQCALYIQGTRLTYAHFYRLSNVGSVYVGKVKNVAKNINACFLEIANREICFLPLKDAQNPILVNRSYDGRILQGDEILVQVVRDAQKNKQATVTANVPNTDGCHEKAKHSTCFSCLKKASAIDYLSVVTQSIVPDDIDEIITDDELVYKELLKKLEKDSLSIPVRHYTDTTFPLRLIYGLQSKLETALEERIWLKSGAFIVIQSTEAMTVIDVNSGKYEPSGRSEEEIALLINKEASEEIALQLKLRNLSGIIIVDFINMREKDNNKELLDYLRRLTSVDPVRTVVVDMTKLGLVELTRKKIRKPLKEQLFEQ